MFTRRKFIRILTILFGAMTAMVPSLARAKKMALSMDRVEKLKKVGGWTILKIKDKNFLFIRNAEKSIKVLNPECTHKKCTVAFNSESGRIECPCHGSMYDVDGKVLTGPASKALQTYESSLSEDQLKIIFATE